MNKSAGVALLHVNLTAMLPVRIGARRARAKGEKGQIRPGTNLAAIGGALERSVLELIPVRQPAHQDHPLFRLDPPSDHTCSGRGRPADDAFAVGVKGEIGQAVKAAMLFSRPRVPQDDSVFVSS